MGLRWKLVSAFLAIFLIGGFCGSALTLAIAQIKIRGATPGNPHRWEDALMKNLTSKIGLTPDQQTQIRPQIAAALQQMKVLRQQLVLQSDDVLDQTLQRFETQLTPDQQTRMEAFRKKRKERNKRQLEMLKR
jgi:hypothetical protein